MKKYDIEKIKMCLGKAIKAERKARRKTQWQLADLAKIGRCTLADIERGRRIPNTETLMMLCNTLGVSIDYLMNKAQEETK